MKKIYGFLILVCVIAVTAAVVLWFIVYNIPPAIKDYSTIPRAAAIRPDYTDTVVPPNIAPLNFMVVEKGTEYVVKIHSANGKSVNVFSRTGKINIPAGPWKRLLSANKGGELAFDIYVKDKTGSWNRYNSITNKIAGEDIDSYLVYRFMKPIFNWWHNIAIYQRQMESYGKKVILHGKSFRNGCLNCHSFLNNDTQHMTIGVRSSSYGSSTLMAGNGKVDKIGTKWGYTSWHPSGRLAVYSMNKVRQFFHKTTAEIRDVVDLDSAICYYLLDSKETKTTPALSEKDRLETYPSWSPDGKYLYFCSAPILWTDMETVPPKDYDKVKYDLRRVSYDVEKDQWGQAETVLSAKETGKSLLLPRISPDGRFLVFCMCDYGCFPIYQTSSDLYLMELETGKYEKLGINSEFSESWHSFSSNSRWMAFSSKRRDGQFTRTYFSYIDTDGKVYKPFILPQKDPTYYDRQLQTYSVPELIKNPVEVRAPEFARAVRGSREIDVDIPISGATSKAQSSDPWQQARE